MDESLAVIFYVVFVNTMTSESFFFSDKPGSMYICNIFYFYLRTVKPVLMTVCIKVSRCGAFYVKLTCM